MNLPFTKMNGAGNDFVMLDNRNASFTLTREQIMRLCDRHRGVGGDGVIMLESAKNGADFRMRYYNADGGEAEMCGNGARCFARYARQVSGHSQETISFETPAGVISASCVDKNVRIDMSAPHSYAVATTLESDGQDFTIHSINTGVPHAIMFVKDLRAVDVLRLGAGIRYHSHFAPKGTNVNFVQIHNSNEIAVRTYERGVEGETLACGTGVVACALIHHIETGAPSPLSVVVQSGETLRVDFKAASTIGDFKKVTLTGPADFVFDGTVAL